MKRKSPGGVDEARRKRPGKGVGEEIKKRSATEKERFWPAKEGKKTRP